MQESDRAQRQDQNQVAQVGRIFSRNQRDKPTFRLLLDVTMGGNARGILSDPLLISFHKTKFWAPGDICPPAQLVAELRVAPSLFVGARCIGSGASGTEQGNCASRPQRGPEGRGPLWRTPLKTRVALALWSRL